VNSYDQAAARTWGWGVESRYNTGEQHIDEIGASLTLRIDCMTFQLRTSYRPSYTSSSGFHQGNDYRAALIVRFNNASKNYTPSLFENKDNL